MRPRGSAPNDHLKWSAVHKRLLREAYGKADTAVIASVLGRTEGAVEEMARTLGLTAPDPRRWSEGELDELGRLRLEHPMRVVAGMLGRSVESCKHKTAGAARGRGPEVPAPARPDEKGEKMNSTAEKLREAAAYIKDYGVASVMAIARVRDALGVGKTDTTARDLGAVLDTIADELESAEDKAERRKKHIGYLETALHDKNAVLKRRGEAIARVTAENADLRKQVPSERERQILAMWPRFEDGDPVMPGDKVHYASTHNVETEIEVESITVMDGLFVLCDDECRSNQYEQGQRVKRPVQSVLDADGVETKSGDTVYLLKDGDKCRVTGFETIDGEVFARLHCDDRPEIEGARGSAITHRRRVLDADGVEIRAGDTVWFRSLSTGDRMRKATVTGFGEYSLDGPLATLKTRRAGLGTSTRRRSLTPAQTAGSGSRRTPRSTRASMPRA